MRLMYVLMIVPGILCQMVGHRIKYLPPIVFRHMNQPKVGNLELNVKNATIQMIIRFGDDSYCENWSLTRID